VPNKGDMGKYVEMDFKKNKKYAMCRRKIELGIWCADLKKVKGVYLTTWDKAIISKGEDKGKSRNTWTMMKNDLRQLRYSLEKKGLEQESCFVPELTDEKGLLHLHGFMRFEEIIKCGELNSILSHLWGKIHDSPIVYSKDLYSIDGVMKYNLKDAVKNYASAEVFGGRVLCSRNWLPKGWKIAQKEVVKWYLENRYPDWVKDEAGIDQYHQLYDEDSGRNPVYLAKEIMNDYIWRWARGEEIRLDYVDHAIYIQGTNIYERINEAGDIFERDIVGKESE